MKEYPLWKKVAWRYGRAFVATFLASLSTQILMFQEDLTLTALRSAIFASFAAGLQALSKVVRDVYGDKKYSSPVHKMPV